MRDSGAAATSPPKLSASVWVAPGTAYTIVSMGPASHLGVQVLMETMKSSPGKALVRVVQESVQQHSVTVSAGDRALGGPLRLSRRLVPSAQVRISIGVAIRLNGWRKEARRPRWL